MGQGDLTIPGVEVLDELGHGVHGTVYRARRLGRYYALKLPRTSSLLEPEIGAEHANRFLKEAVSLARVRHPALPAVMEVGRAGALPYLIMELVAGETLAESLRRGPLEEWRAIDLGVQLSDVVACIHEAGLVHRDIKPHNILFDSLSAGVRLIDFGYAESNPRLTPSESGDTPTHASNGGAREAQTDLRALGSVLFQSATGFVPFVEVDPRPLLERSGERSNLLPRLSPGFSGILRRLLLSSGDLGYSDARALANDLKSLLPANARPEGAPLNSEPSSESALHARQRELERTIAALEASAAGPSQVVIVRGVPGSGKTRLIRSLLERSRDTHLHLVAVCEQSQREPLGAVRKLLEAELSEFEKQPPSERLRSIGRFRELANDVAPLLRLLSARLAHVLRTGIPETVREDVATVTDEALAKFMARLLSSGPPRVVVIDDVQWLDAGSRRVLGYLSSNDLPRVLFLLAGRDDASSWPALERILRTLDTARIWEIVLEPLDEAQVSEFLRGYLGAAEVSDELVQYVTGVSDGTPLNVLHVLHSILEGGALVPYWGQWRFDGAAASGLALPRGSLELLSQRLRRLSSDTLRLLTAAAVDGMSFDASLLERTCGMTEPEVTSALEDARRAMLLQTTGPEYRFFHDSVREALLLRLSPGESRQLHQKLAEAIDRKLASRPSTHEGSPPKPASEGRDPSSFPVSFDAGDFAETETRAALEIYRLANHYADGDIGKEPQRALEVCLEAGKLAFRGFDNDLALRFFGVARSSAEILGIDLGLEFEERVAEVELRTGNLAGALARLYAVAEGATDTVARARAFSRIAWAEMQLDVDRAWNALFAGFRALGAAPPKGSLWGVLRAIASWLRWLVAKPSPARSTERPRLRVLCQLNDQAARLAADTALPTRLLQAVLGNLVHAERLGVSRALSSAYLGYSFVLAALGLHRASKHRLTAAELIARKTKDPAAYAHALQVHAVISAWSGDIRDAVTAGARSLEEYGHFRDLSDYCLTAYNQQQIEGIRGRNLEAWKALEHALNKLGKHEGPALTLEFLELGVRAALTALGREKDIEASLSRIANVSTRPPTRGAIAQTTHGTRVRLFTESGRLDEEFEKLVAAVRDQELDPRKVHIIATEYYVHVAHARVHACLRCAPADLPRKSKLLDDALRDLALAARMPLFRAHALTIEGYVAYFRGDFEAAERLFSRAHRLGSDEAAPWVLYAVHRGRAHLLRARGIPESAIDEARLAEALAREHGAAYRLLWIREEFGLSPRGSRAGYDGSPLSSGSPGTLLEGTRARTRSRSHLKSLVRIGQHTAKEFGLAQQAKIVLAELIEAARAERGFLFLTQERLAEETEASDEPRTASASAEPVPAGEPKRMIPMAAQNATGRELAIDSNYDHEFVEDTLARGFRLPGTQDNGLLNVVTTTHEGRSVMAAPLMIRGERMGAVYLDRPHHLGAFSEADSRTLATLAIQVPLVFELARFLRERERVEETQRSAEKLEAIARLAGGIAHDFNNMLSVILGVSDQILTQRSSRSIGDDIKTVQSAAERARDLTHQLLAFSRGQYLRPEVLQLNDLIRKLEPIFRQLLGDDTELRLELDGGLCRVKADPAQIDQVLTNLIVNAHDAMPSGGTLTIESVNLVLSSGREANEVHLPPGRYACITVTDTGIGMDAAVRAKIFEPFFTTKATGNGLGLPTAYGIVKQSGGHIDVESRPGKGTTFRILLPETEQRTSVPAPSQRPSDVKGSETVLLVDDEPLVREATRRTLRSLGYQVIGAKSADDALRIVAEQGSSIQLVITDVMMPGMNGLELAREIGKVRPSLKVLFISGFTAGVLAERGFLSANVDFIQKPVSREALAKRMRDLLEAKPGKTDESSERH